MRPGRRELAGHRPVTSGEPRRTTTDAGLWTGLNPVMAMAAKGVVLAFVLATVWDVDAAGAVFGRIRSGIEGTLGWFYFLVVCTNVLACLFLVCSRYGRIRLGDDASSPEFKTSSWLAMLFSAGIGIGLLFFSIAEPLFYFDTSQAAGYPNNPSADLAGAMALDEQRAVHAMRVTYFHWGIHGWSVYVVVGLCLAYFGFRKKLPLTLRSVPANRRPYLRPDRRPGGPACGVWRRLRHRHLPGLGGSQMATGLDVLLGVDPGLVTQVALIAAISLAATLSAVSGVDLRDPRPVGVEHPREHPPVGLLPVAGPLHVARRIRCHLPRRVPVAPGAHVSLDRR